MAAPPFTNLDFQQAIRGAYDEAEGRFRVETAATIVNGAVEVAIDASTDNIQIRDPSSGHNLKVNADGSLNISGTSVVTGSVTTNQAGLDSFQTEQYTIGTSVVQLTPSPLLNRSSISIRVDKNNTGAIYIGNSNSVTVFTGYPLFAGDTLGMDLTDSSTIFAISDSPSQRLAVLEIA